MYRNQYCLFNDDIQGTAAAALAGLLACKEHTGRPVSAETFLFYGAGAVSFRLRSSVPFLYAFSTKHSRTVLAKS
ncbi:unnamed protein product [Gongylonema pulchrum]|uniref:Malic_M domain-containing protein n=1 Tax=Gongylonema pulchrum TaxID=637853 RepID=A0A183DLF3_9BILA|nr:unnamed protein product [Gongylonema pulchrum]